MLVPKDKENVANKMCYLIGMIFALQLLSKIERIMNSNDPKNGKTIFDLLNQIDEEDKWLEQISDLLNDPQIEDSIRASNEKEQWLDEISNLLDDPQIDVAIRGFEEKTKSEEELIHDPQVAKAVELLHEKDAKRKMQQHRWHCKNRYGISVEKGKRFVHYMNDERIVPFCDDDKLNKVILADIEDKMLACSFESDIVLELQYLFDNISPSELYFCERSSDLFRIFYKIRNKIQRELYKILYAYTSLNAQECDELCFKWLGLSEKWEDLYECYKSSEQEFIQQVNDAYDAKCGYLDCLGLDWEDLPPGTNPYSIDLD